MCLTLQVMCRTSRARTAAANGTAATASSPSGQQEPLGDELADVEENDELICSNMSSIEDSDAEWEPAEPPAATPVCAHDQDCGRG